MSARFPRNFSAIALDELLSLVKYPDTGLPTNWEKEPRSMVNPASETL